MDIEKIINDLESNQTRECEQAKKKLLELLSQYKDQSLVGYMMDYFIKTGSLRIMEVLVKMQSPYDSGIFDRLAEWLKTPTHRVQALDLFCYVVRKHPTWLYKVEKHRLIRDIFKLMLSEKEIVPLMSALVCIITLLPIIPNLVPNFLNDLFEVFGHLASWNCQNPNRLPDDKLVHLQLGLQMLFHRLYGMYPCNFLAYLGDFIKKEKGGIFHHTIKPLLETVRMHPMLVTATLESEVSHSRWKEMEPHDVVVECAKLSLPVMHQDESIESTFRLTSSELFDTQRAALPPSSAGFIHSKKISSGYSSYQELKHRQGPLEFDSGINSGINATIWSPYNEIITSGPIPLTPTPSYTLPTPTASNINNQLLGVTGSSPPEAAVEATPETTPMKDIKEPKHSNLVAAVGNPHAVRAIFASSQPSSPMRKEHNQFHFPDSVADTMADMSAKTTTVTTEHERLFTRTRVTTTYDRRMQQILQDRTQSHSPFQTIETLAEQQQRYRSPSDAMYKCPTPEMVSGMSSPMIDSTATPTPTSIPTPVEHITKVCDNCNETEISMCTAGGLQIPTSRSMQLLAKRIKKRNRMASYCYNDSSCEKISASRKDIISIADSAKVRRTKSCSSIYSATTAFKTDDGTDDDSDAQNEQQHNERRLQKSGKMIAIAKSTKKAVGVGSAVTVASQTVEIMPHSYEQILFTMLMESNELREQHERNLLDPNEILEQYILRTLRSKDKFDVSYHQASLDQEQFQLLCLQLQYERYRREIHAERNRRLMGRSRDKRSLEMERDRLREQLKNFEAKNKELVQQIDKTMKTVNERDQKRMEELTALSAKYLNEFEQNKCLRQANENLQTRLTEELSKRKDINYELESLRGQIFSLKTELERAQLQADLGLQCKQELARLEAEFIVMGEVQIKCRDRLAEMDNYRARSEELQMLQESYNIELKDMKHTLAEKSSQLDSAKQMIVQLQAQLVNNEKVITEQKRLLKAAKDKYEEQFKSLNKKYEVQKTIITQMEEKIMMSLHKPPNVCSPDTDKTDIASSMDRNSPLSTSLASSESLSASLRSTELRNLQQLVDTTPMSENGSSINVVVSGAGVNVAEASRMPALEANTATASAINIVAASSISATVTATHNYDITAASTSSHPHPHLHLQQQQQQKR